MRMAVSAGAAITPGRYFASGSSNEIVPCSTSCRMDTAVNIFPMDPKIIRVLGVFRTPNSLTASP